MHSRLDQPLTGKSTPQSQEKGEIRLCEPTLPAFLEPQTTTFRALRPHRAGRRIRYSYHHTNSFAYTQRRATRTADLDTAQFDEPSPGRSGG